VTTSSDAELVISDIAGNQSSQNVITNFSFLLKEAVEEAQKYDLSNIPSGTSKN
jgi:hypothetical protein